MCECIFFYIGDMFTVKLKLFSVGITLFPRLGVVFNCHFLFWLPLHCILGGVFGRFFSGFFPAYSACINPLAMLFLKLRT